MDPMDLETKPQVDRLRCWRERSVTASTAPNSDRLCTWFSNTQTHISRKSSWCF